MGDLDFRSRSGLDVSFQNACATRPAGRAASQSQRGLYCPGFHSNLLEGGTGTMKFRRMFLDLTDTYAPKCAYLYKVDSAFIMGVGGIYLTRKPD